MLSYVIIPDRLYNHVSNNETNSQMKLKHSGVNPEVVKNQRLLFYGLILYSRYTSRISFILCVHDKWIRWTMQPQATGSTPMEIALFSWLRIEFSAYIGIRSCSSPNSGNMKLWWMIIKFFSNETLISVCWSLSEE